MKIYFSIHVIFFLKYYKETRKYDLFIPEIKHLPQFTVLWRMIDPINLKEALAHHRLDKEDRLYISLYAFILEIFYLIFKS